MPSEPTAPADRDVRRHVAAELERVCPTFAADGPVLPGGLRLHELLAFLRTLPDNLSSDELVIRFAANYEIRVFNEELKRTR